MKRTIKHVFLDKELTPRKREVFAEAMRGKTQAQIAKSHNMEERTIQNGLQDSALTAMVNAKTLQRIAKMNEILDKCDEIISKHTSAEPRYSDKIAAMRLKGEILGILGKHAENVTINIGVSDLKSASEAELRAELDRIEEKKGSIIDME